MSQFSTDIADHLQRPTGDFSRSLRKCSSCEWEEQGQRNAMSLFRQAAARVPAYRDFLQRHGIDTNDIRTLEDFAGIPSTDKQNYIDRYELRDLMWDGTFASACLFNTSSGTAGKNYLWPTADTEMIEAADLYEHILSSSFDIEKRSTLLVICFGLGTWIAGSYTYNATQYLKRKENEFTIITPGFDREHAESLTCSLAKEFDQVIVAGIPSFVRDFVTESKLPKRKIRFLLSGEGFSEAWRDYVAGATEAQPKDIVSIYGSADAGLMGFESTNSIGLRRRATRTHESSFFRGTSTPMLFQYVPTHRFYELERDELLLTANRAIPLIRYNLHDQVELFRADDVGSDDSSCLPYVAVYGRGAFGATLYGANVHATDVGDVFLDPSLARHVTGRFVFETNYNDTQQQRLELFVELRDSIDLPRKLDELIVARFVEHLRTVSSEYERILEEYPKSAFPTVVLCPPGASGRFPLEQTKIS